jgi:hypothetical protein
MDTKMSQKTQAEVLACAEVSAATKERLRAEQPPNNPFALTREVERQIKVIEQNRRRVEA